eukprot:64752-Chlamydomonas_euryale.AAC.1
MRAFQGTDASSATSRRIKQHQRPQRSGDVERARSIGIDTRGRRVVGIFDAGLEAGSFVGVDAGGVDAAAVVAAGGVAAGVACTHTCIAAYCSRLTDSCRATAMPVKYADDIAGTSTDSSRPTARGTCTPMGDSTCGRAGARRVWGCKVWAGPPAPAPTAAHHKARCTCTWS